MIPKKSKKVIEQVSEDLDLPENVVDDIISFYYKEVRKTLSSLEHIKINIDGLGHFVIKQRSVEKMTRKFEAIMNKYDTETFANYHNRKSAELKLEKLKHAKNEIDKYHLEKKNFRDGRKD